MGDDVARVTPENACSALKSMLEKEVDGYIEITAVRARQVLDELMALKMAVKEIDNDETGALLREIKKVNEELYEFLTQGREKVNKRIREAEDFVNNSEIVIRDLQRMKEVISYSECRKLSDIMEAGEA